MTKINNINIEFKTVVVELGLYNQLSNVDTINKIINIQTSSAIRYIPQLITTEISLQTEKQAATGLYERALGSSTIHNVGRNLGNTEVGDGHKFIGRGLKQLTGRFNYTRASKDLYGDDRLVKNPDLVATDKTIALETACWFWSKNNLSAIADSWDITTLSKKVNGGTIGLDKRILYSDQARTIMKA